MIESVGGARVPLVFHFFEVREPDEAQVIVDTIECGERKRTHYPESAGLFASYSDTQSD